MASGSSRGGQEQATSKASNHPQYELLYHPSIPGRAEFIRLVFEAARVPYLDVSNERKDGYGFVQQTCMKRGSLESADNNPPIFAPPALRVPGAGKNGNALVISQTPNILSYVGVKVGLVPQDEADRLHVQQLVLTALDLTNEVHDTHHPIAVHAYYDEQKEEGLKKAQDVRENRIPKYLSYFDCVRRHNQEHGNGKGKYLVGDKLTYADTTVWQALDGCIFAFPREMEARKKEFPQLLGQDFYEAIKNEPGIKEYLASERRMKYGNGIWRQYTELDRP